MSRIRLRVRCNQTLAVVATALGVGACAYNKGTVVLLPEKDGRDSSVVVMQGDQRIVLDQPYAAARQTAFGSRAFQSSPQEVEAVFGSTLAAQPMRPTKFTLYFVEASDEFTEDSKRTIESVIADIAKHPVPDIVIVGHTDRVGSDPYNDNLSRQRAETMRAELIRRGIAPENIVAVARGSREPLVPTAAGVAEPRNRRVEIIVR